ncbi:Rft protein-domain-containing protein, partial [Blastocladiella britannica]
MLTGNADLAAGTTAPAAKPNGQVAAAVSGAGYMFALQLFSKFVTFFANQLLLRLVSPAVFGVASIQCELLVSSVLFFAREPARLALLRAPIYDTSSTSALRRRIDPTKLGLMINLSWLPLAAGTPLALVLGYYWIHYLPVSELGAGYATAVQLYALGTLLDLAAEPLVALIVATTQLKARAIAEGVALTASCGTALALTWLSGGEAGILAFGWARVAFGLGYLCSYAAAVISRFFCFFLSASPILTEKNRHITAYFDPASLAVAWSFVKQSVLKHFLTEGDKFVLSLFFTPRDQGIYALVFNYGSIVARLVFLPLEDAARLLFSRMAATDYRTTARSLLELALKFHLTLGLFAIVFGTQYSAPALVVLAGPQWLVPATDGGVINAYAAWGTAPVALAAYCWFIPVLGVNGILEAFVTATATPTDLHAQGYWLVGGAGVFAASAWLLYPLGATGLVVANAVHLLVRVVWAARYV